VTPPRPQLHVVGRSDSFQSLWKEVCERLDLELVLLPEPEPVRESRSLAVLLVCAGEEEAALELLHGASRAGLEGPLIVGAREDHRLAVELMRRGAGAYYALPGDADGLEAELEERRRKLEPADRGALEQFRREAYDFDGIIGEDPALRAALDRAARAIPQGRATVLLSGETGTGKELLAHAIHYNGPRASEAFVAVNCAAIPSSLLESELFGHEKGAFTDARAAKPGLFQVADGGTLFLDEVAVLAPELQGKLLRVLESGEVRRVGGVRTEEVDVRIIAAANVDLAGKVSAGEFRQDLYYRLAVLPIHLPPLRERGKDVRILARHLLARLAETYELEHARLTPAAVRALERHPWPGNVRELRNAMERALLLAGGSEIGPDHLALEETTIRARPAPPGLESLPFPASLETLEEAAVLRMIELSSGNKSEAARRLGITRSRLYRILRRAGDGDDTDEADEAED